MGKFTEAKTWPVFRPDDAEYYVPQKTRTRLKVVENGLYGILDTERGKLVIPCKYNELYTLDFGWWYAVKDGRHMSRLMSKGVNTAPNSAPSGVFAENTCAARG